MSNQGVDINQCKDLLLRRARKVHNWDARTIVERITSGHSDAEIRAYARLGDDELLPLFDAAKKSIESARSQQPHSAGREDYPALSSGNHAPVAQTGHNGDLPSSQASSQQPQPPGHDFQSSSSTSALAFQTSDSLFGIYLPMSFQAGGFWNGIWSSLPAESVAHQQSWSTPGGGMAVNYQNAHPNVTGYPLDSSRLSWNPPAPDGQIAHLWSSPPGPGATAYGQHMSVPGDGMAMNHRNSHQSVTRHPPNYHPATGYRRASDALSLNFNGPGTIAYQQHMSAPDGQIGQSRSSAPGTTAYQMRAPDDGMARNHPYVRQNVSSSACGFHFSKMGCRNGERCWYSHAERKVYPGGLVASGSNKIHVAFDHRSGITEELLLYHFEKYGSVASVSIPYIETPKYGFVSFNHPTLVLQIDYINQTQAEILVNPYVERSERLKIDLGNGQANRKPDGNVTHEHRTGDNATTSSHVPYGSNGASASHGNNSHDPIHDLPGSIEDVHSVEACHRELNQPDK